MADTSNAQHAADGDEDWVARAGQALIDANLASDQDGTVHVNGSLDAVLDVLSALG